MLEVARSRGGSVGTRFEASRTSRPPCAIDRDTYHGLAAWEKAERQAGDGVERPTRWPGIGSRPTALEQPRSTIDLTGYGREAGPGDGASLRKR